MAGRRSCFGARDYRASSSRRSCEKILSILYAEFEIVAYVTQIHKVVARINRSSVKAEDIEKNIVRCPDDAATKKMVSLIEEVRGQGDSVGGVIECIIRGIPPGLGEPVFDKLDADLAKAMLSIPATKGFEIGSGFTATRMRGSQHNDPFEVRGGIIRAATNNSGGVQGGISNGEEIYFRVAFKPTATIGQEQKTVTSSRRQTRLAARGRHDPCVLPERCQSWKQWPRWCFAITRSGSKQLVVNHSDI